MAISKIVYKSSPSATGEVWMDATPATAEATDIMAPKTAMLANGVLTTGTGSGGSGVVEAEEKDVNFYDYDGIRLYSYTAAEAQALSELPANPAHSGLTAQGWNWTLAQIKTQLTTMGGVVEVGQNYVTTSGATEVDVVMDDPNHLSPYMAICINGTVSVDWGDNTTTDTMTGTSITSIKTQLHTYSSTGKYTIKITVVSGAFSFHSSGYLGFLWMASSGSLRNNVIYMNMVTDIRLGNNANIGNYAFNYCSEIKSITLPSSLSEINQYAFARCTNLKCVIVPSSVTEISNHMFDSANMSVISIPYGITTIGEYAFSQCRSLKHISVSTNLSSIGRNAFASCFALRRFIMSSSVTTIAQAVFNACIAIEELELSDDLTTIATEGLYYLWSLEKLTIPSKVTSIGQYGLRMAYSLKELHFLPSMPPTLYDANVFQNLNPDCVIYVPTGKLSAYTSAQYYPSSATYTYVEE